jgi:hypothetical protein
MITSLKTLSKIFLGHKFQNSNKITNKIKIKDVVLINLMSLTINLCRWTTQIINLILKNKNK